jgi:diguanylate cyclase (GGDEF)-like protein
MHLRRAVETELGRGPFCIGLKAPLRDTYRAAIAAARSQELISTCQCGSFLYLLAVLLTNLLSPSAPNWSIAATQCCVVPFVALTIAYVSFRPDTPVFLRESGAFAAAACFVLATLLAVCAGHDELTVLNLFLVSLSAVAALFFVQLRLAAAIALVGLTGLALWLAVSARTDVPPQLRGYPLGFLLAISAPALISVHQRERAARQAYLQTLLLDLRIEQLGFENTRLSQLSATDSLTGAANRRQLEAALRKLCAEPPAGDFLLLADIDFFKHFNDRHGHMAGDACLREVVTAIRSQLRRADLVARFGGEEFAIVLPNTTRMNALATAERIRTAVANQTVTVNGRSETVTISIGLAERSTDMSPISLLALADNALYTAKHEGRNRVHTATQMLHEAAA